MDSFEINKMVGALLGALVLTMGVGFVAEAIFEHGPPAKPGYDLPVPKKTAAAASSAPAPEVPLPVLLAKASVQKGEDDTHVCQTCHNFEKGAGVKIGPPLYGVVGRPVASVAGFDYSDALKQKKGDWTFDKLFQWIKDPSAYAPGTKMAFAGEPDPQRRADILVYLRSLSDKPVPLPPAPKAAPAPKKTAAPASASASVAAPKAAAAGGDAFAQMVAKASPSAGEQDTQVCQICHDFSKGGGVKIGPPLYGVLGRKIASVAGFDYSDALKKKGGVWTYDLLNTWITDPNKFAPGTKMTFAGEPSEKKRADIVAYLRTLSDKPAPLPGASSAAPAKNNPPTAPSAPSPSTGAAAPSGSTK